MRLSRVMPWMIAALGVGAACEPTYPGDALGAYGVTENLLENTCGPGLPALSTVQFQVELRADGALGYWRLPRQGVVVGSYRASDGAFEFRSVRSVVAWAPDLASDVAGCTLEQRELIRGTVSRTDAADAAAPDAAAPDAAAPDAGPDNDAGAGSSDPLELLVGEHTIDVIAARDSDCTALLASSGGSFDVMPCRARYTLRGAAATTAF